MMQLEKMKNFIFSKGVDKVNTLIPWRGGFFMEGPGGGSRMFAYPGGLNRPKRLNAAPDGLCQSICLLRGQLDQTHRIFRQKHLYIVDVAEHRRGLRMGGIAVPTLQVDVDAVTPGIFLHDADDL